MTQTARQAIDLAGELLPRQIAVLRALQLGDLLCAVPAFRALRSALPETEVVLLGLPWARSFVDRFDDYIDDFMEVPGFPGLPEQAPAPDRLPTFLGEVQARRFDLVLQMHGCGTITNPLAMLFGGRRTAGFYLPGQYCPDPATFLPYPAHEPEIRRHLRLLQFLGVPPRGEELEVPLRPEDEAALNKLDAGGELHTAGPYVCLHAGARALEGRWPVECFAAVADRLAARGLQIVLTGSGDEVDLARRLAAGMQARALNLAGQTNLGGLAALLYHARLLICNDTGVSHLAAALRTPSVVVFTRPESQGWPPLDRVRHRVVSHITQVPWKWWSNRPWLCWAKRNVPLRTLRSWPPAAGHRLASFRSARFHASAENPDLAHPR
jgi:ADP-heptose:LPS heptosyltransferase